MAFIDNVIADHRLDVLALTETWIPSDAPNAVKLDIAPPGYCILRRHRTARRPADVAAAWQSFTGAPSRLQSPTSQFESTAIKIVTRRSSIVVIRVYRLPSDVGFHSPAVRSADSAGLVTSQLLGTSMYQDRSLDSWTAVLLSFSPSMDFDRTSVLQPTSAATF